MNGELHACPLGESDVWPEATLDLRDLARCMYPLNPKNKWLPTKNWGRQVLCTRNKPWSLDLNLAHSLLGQRVGHSLVSNWGTK